VNRSCYVFNRRHGGPRRFRSGRVCVAATGDQGR
jgi:hypothetical protein